MPPPCAAASKLAAMRLIFFVAVWLIVPPAIAFSIAVFIGAGGYHGRELAKLCASDANAL